MSIRNLMCFSLVLAMMLLGVVNNASAALLAQYEFEGNYNPTVGTEIGTTPSTTWALKGVDYTNANAATTVTDGTTVGTHSFGDVLQVSSDFVKGDITTTLDFVWVGPADIVPLYNTTAITLAAWVKFDGQNLDNAIIGAAGGHWVLGTDKTTGYDGMVNIQDAVAEPLESTGSDFQDGGWHHLAGTYDGYYYRIYIDGALNNSVAATGNIGAWGTGGDWGIGIELQNLTTTLPDTAFVGWIDDVRIYSDVRTLTQIQELSGIPEPTTVALLGLGGLFLLRRRR